MTTRRKSGRSSWGKTRKLPSGRYQASYVGPDGERYPGPMTYSTKGDAETWLAGQRSDIATGKWVPRAETETALASRAQPLSEYTEAWLLTRTNARGDGLRPRTVDEYRRLLRGALVELGPAPIGSLTPARVRRWRADQLATGRKTQTSRAYGLLNAVMGTAVIDGLLVSNPCVIKGGQSTYTGRKVLPPTDAELETILDAITPRYRALVVIAAMAGLRYGEATELRARDVTIERDESGSIVTARLSVERAVTYTASGGFVVGSTKSAAGLRKVAVFGRDAVDIAEHVRGLIGEALLFPARGGARHLAQSSFIKHWYPAREAAGRSDMPFHALRHYAGTRYAQAGATPRETMARLGHSSLGSAMRYQHAGNRDDELAARMSKRSTSA